LLLRMWLKGGKKARGKGYRLFHHEASRRANPAANPISTTAAKYRP
jgi:hypothetical protein